MHPVNQLVALWPAYTEDEALATRRLQQQNDGGT
jgi:hypothetical protein